MKILQSRRSLAVVVGMKKTNDHAEPTKNRKLNVIIKKSQMHGFLWRARMKLSKQQWITFILCCTRDSNANPMYYGIFWGRVLSTVPSRWTLYTGQYLAQCTVKRDECQWDLPASLFNSTSNHFTFTPWSVWAKSTGQ